MVGRAKNSTTKLERKVLGQYPMLIWFRSLVLWQNVKVLALLTARDHRFSLPLPGGQMVISLEFIYLYPTSMYFNMLILHLICN
jgi:hypothetical protein